MKETAFFVLLGLCPGRKLCGNAEHCSLWVSKMSLVFRFDPCERSDGGRDE